MSKNQSYSPEFRAEAVRLVLEQGLSQPAAASSTIITAHWRDSCRNRPLDTR
jgi:transposase-like protein